MTLPKELTTVTLVSRIVELIVLVAAMIISFGLGVNYQETIDLLKQQNSSIQVTMIKPTTPIYDETANWKRYTDKNNILSFTLPSNYLINPDSDEPIRFLNWSGFDVDKSNLLGIFWSTECQNGNHSGYILNCFKFGVYKLRNTSGKSLYEYSHRDFYPECQESPRQDVPQCRGDADIDKQIIIEGKKAYFLQGRLGPAVTHIEIYIDLGNQNFIHIGTNDLNNVAKIGQEAKLKEAKIEEFDQILSTFKFTN